MYRRNKFFYIMAIILMILLLVLYYNLYNNMDKDCEECNKYVPHMFILDKYDLYEYNSNKSNMYYTVLTENVKYRYNISDKEFNEFVRIVEAEVTGESPYGLNYEDAFNCKLRVAQVILNRVESDQFPNTVHDVIFQKNAFTPILDGRYNDVEITQVTIDACKAALLNSTKDLTYGCEFFSSNNIFCKYGTYVFTDEVGHSFFKMPTDISK